MGHAGTHPRGTSSLHEPMLLYRSCHINQWINQLRRMIMEKVKSVVKAVLKDKRFWGLVAVAVAALGVSVVPAGTIEAVGCALAGGCV
ncbi:hypothetical protein [Ralstonia phage phiITL-1]|uniref:Uncharacterized protein n=1 Tax=Ralstonia phage phiITL-1 TaxID=1597967 RepID=A0A0U1ZDZ8_9CAUD|nr:hypothetical protein HOR02_gp13 [Ralstonia phage phiITL-1]AJT60798.1 hypothetical protein [Ralstonia phage phiITL-1]